MSRQSSGVILRVIASLAIAVGGLDAAVSQDVPEAFEVCIACHAYLPNEPPLDGPSLWQVVGRSIASIDSFEYSAGLRGVAGHWDRPTLDRFLAAPELFAPGTRMTFGGVRNAADRTVVLDFLETLTLSAGADEPERHDDDAGH